uniref:Uncharacterized protein n=1 Tax=Nelumbo nucifera TaxID=4432 RepID=A0A822Z786_NELNU|nr:TPA_asm: hypothetical protein HUJ06_014746 [Nelumbo nucifera]
MDMSKVTKVLHLMSSFVLSYLWQQHCDRANFRCNHRESFRKKGFDTLLGNWHCDYL